jgi:hypothetical protein
MKAPAIATGAPKPAAPSMSAPKQNATSRTCRRRFLHDLELPGFDGNVVQVDSGEHDPGYFQQAERHPVTETEGREGKRHAEKHDRYERCSQRAEDRAPVWPDLQSDQQSEQDNDGKRGHQRR